MVVTNRVPRARVVPPTFRTAEFLPRAVASVEPLSSEDWELSFVDENEPGSHERREVLATYALERRIHFVRHAMNATKGLEAARSRDASSATMLRGLRG